MAGNVVFLAFDNKNAEEDIQSLIGCKHCKNKTFKVKYFLHDFPIMQCAACDAHIGRIGWVPDAP